MTENRDWNRINYFAVHMERSVTSATCSDSLMKVEENGRRRLSYLAPGVIHRQAETFVLRC